MDFKNLNTTSELALGALFKYIWHYIPEKYRLRYDEAEVVETLWQFYDPDLDFQNRGNYRVAKVPYSERKTSWITFMWNIDSVQKTNEQDRVFKTYYLNDEHNRTYSLVAGWTALPVTLGVVSNDPVALLEFQEVLTLGIREKEAPEIEDEHPMLGKFVTNIMSINFNGMSKVSKETGTMLLLYCNVLLQYIIAGFMSETGIIKSIRTNYRDFEKERIRFTDIIKPENEN